MFVVDYIANNLHVLDYYKFVINILSFNLFFNYVSFKNPDFQSIYFTN